MLMDLAKAATNEPQCEIGALVCGGTYGSCSPVSQTTCEPGVQRRSTPEAFSRASNDAPAGVMGPQQGSEAVIF